MVAIVEDPDLSIYEDNDDDDEDSAEFD